MFWILELDTIEQSCLKIKYLKIVKQQLIVYGLHTCVGSRMSFQIKSIIESLATEGTQVSFGIAVAFHVSIQ